MRTGTRAYVSALAGFLIVAVGLPLGSPPPAAAVSPDLVISQIYGAGGNTNALLTHDYVELFNRGDAAVSLDGLSLQYASATGTGNFGGSATQLTELPDATVSAGQYFLVQQAGGANGSPLPTPDFIDPTPIAMAAGAGKVALVSGTTSLGCNGSTGQPCDEAALARIIDLVGYGNANFFEGSAAAPTISTTLADFRAGGGCQDTDDNAADFSTGTPAPRNSSSALNPCAGGVTLSIDDVSLNEGDSGTTAFDFTVSLSAAAEEGGVTFDIATQDGTATVADDDYLAGSLTGQTIPAGSSSYDFTVLVNGDTAEESDETFFVNVTNVSGADVADGQGLGTIVDDDTDFCALPYTPIYDIQGSGASAAITGDVSTQGVVVGDFEGSSGLQGFYLQDATGDGDSQTSDGIFVFTGAADTVTAGQLVRVTGFARERFNLTAINGANNNNAPVTDIVDCGTGSVAATDVLMPFPTTDYLERFEGMLVRFPQALVISEYFNYDRFGEIVLGLPLDGETRFFTPTSVVEPGAPAQDRAEEYSLRRITLDDGLGIQNPSFTRHPNGEAFSLSNRFRGGDKVQDAVGVLSFDFSLYRIQPTEPASYIPVNPRPGAPADVGGRLTVASFNTLNFFITPDYPSGNPLDNACGPANDVECRGHDFDQPDEFSRQRDKLLDALVGLDADVVGLNELENSTGVDPLGDPSGLVPGLNDLLGAGTYDHIDTGVIGTDAIKVGLIYKPDVILPVGGFETLDSNDDPRFLDDKNRPALAQTFEEIATGARFTVVVNHLKSKGSDCNDVGDPDTGDGQGNCNLTREAAAQAMVDWLATDPTGSGDPDFLITGDLNSYAREDPIDAVLAGSDDVLGTGDDYTNLIERFGGLFAYSFVFDGQAGYLDHALSSTSLTGQVTGAAEWHINADEPDILDYDTSFKSDAQDALYEPNAYRSSDHDPVIVGLDLAPYAGKVTGAGTFVGGAFDFSAQFADAQTIPSGATSLSLEGGLELSSTDYDWLVVSGDRATYQGTGTLNGTPGYGFLLSVLDVGKSKTATDSIRVKIWDGDGAVVYDSQPGADTWASPTSNLTSGNITIHKIK
jgi:predicted extracellular nuclease